LWERLEPWQWPRSSIRPRNGERIAVYVKTLADGRRSQFGSRQDGDVVAYYWFDGRLGYAVTGNVGSSIVSAAADMVRDIYQ
jgi:anti-sigma factor RsiW